MSPPSRRLSAALLVLLALAAVLPCLLARWPPLYDYYHWVFHGHVFAALLEAGPTDPIHSLFSFDVRPVPNLAVALGMGLLNLAFTAGTAGRIFVATAALLVGFGFRALVRSVQGRPTAVELLGFAWAYGYFAYAGYVGYLFSIGAALFTLALAHRLFARESAPRAMALAGLAGLVALVWCAHLFAWLVVAGVLLVYAAAHALCRSWRRSLGLLLTLVPSLILLAWYSSLAWHTVVGPKARTAVYSTPTDKRISLVDPVLLFLRPDPLPPAAPVVVSNLVGLGLILTVVLASLGVGAAHRVPGRRLAPLRVAAATFALIALFWPFGTLDGMGRPDERMLWPALLIALASLPLRAVRPGIQALAALPVLAVLGLHAVEFRDASRRIESLLSVLLAELPPERPYLALTVWDGRQHGGCDAASAHPGLGQPTLKWIPLVHAIETGRLKTPVMGSGLVSSSYRYDRPDDVTLFINQTDDVPNLFGGADPRFPYIAVIGCEGARAGAESAFADHYAVAARGEAVTVLVHR